MSKSIFRATLRSHPLIYLGGAQLDRLRD